VAKRLARYATQRVVVADWLRATPALLGRLGGPLRRDVDAGGGVPRRAPRAWPARPPASRQFDRSADTPDLSPTEAHASQGLDGCHAFGDAEDATAFMTLRRSPAPEPDGRSDTISPGVELW